MRLPLPPVALLVAVALAGCVADDRPDPKSPDRDAGDGDSAPSVPDDGDGGVEPPGAATLSWARGADVPTARGEVAVATAQGLVYVIGGFDATRAPSPLVESYDPATDTWTMRRPLPLPLHHTAAVGVGASVFVFGGYVGPAFTPTDLAYRYDAAQDLWMPIARLPEARGAHAAAAVNGTVLLAGGVGAAGGLLATAWSYDPAADAWSPAGELPTPRDHLAAAPWRGTVAFLGGREQTLTSNTAAVEAYDPADGTWSAGPSLAKPRGGFAAANLNGTLYAFGGEEAGGIIASVERLGANGTWSLVETLPHGRHGFGAAALPERGAVVLPAGGEQPGFFVSAWNEVLRVRPAPPAA